jgi:F0F1-type ATP synthase membrane subunit b/b'
MRKIVAPSTAPASNPTGWSDLFVSQLLFLNEEDEATFDELLAGVRAAIDPADIIEEMLAADIATLALQIWRWRRLKISLLKASAEVALYGALSRNLKYERYQNILEECLAHILRDRFEFDQQETSAEDLAHRCASQDQDAIAQVTAMLRQTNVTLPKLQDEAKAKKVSELVRGFARREPETLSDVQKILTDAGLNMDNIVADGLVRKLADIERIDRLVATAETRRNAMLREIDRHRAALGGTPRRRVQEIEAKTSDPTEATPAADGKDAA